jgi:RNA polymerase sigma-54 factor
MVSGKLNISLQTRLTQKLLITPQMKQSINILQMPITELVQELNTYIEENPVLEEAQDGDDKPEDTQKEEKFEDDLLKVDWDELYRDNEDIYYTPSSDEGYDFEKFVSSAENLFDRLMFQLKICGLGSERERVGQYIIGNLTEDGYFRTELSEVAQETGSTEAKAAEVLEIIKGFEPSGIASANLKECIYRQLSDFGAEPVYIELVAELLENYEDNLISFRYEEIKENMGIEEDTFDYLLFLIRKTDPRPGLAFLEGENRQIFPDVYIVRKGDDFDVVLNEDGMPSLRTSAYYMKMLKNANVDSKAKEYLEEKIKGAVWLIKSLNKRQKAIYRVVKAVVEAQKPFFKGEAKHLSPLKLKDIAEVTGLHESTVSRVTSGKYAKIEQGVVELKSFFVKGLDTVDGDMSTDRIKDMIKGIVDEEPEEGPHSDQKIVEILQKKGIKIARRTVAKYRDELNIPTKSQRKKTRR